ncbi:MAG: tetratricopeptide repeat protein, partial [Streptosporangiaceae bacterium]
HMRPRVPPAATPAPPLTGPAAARAWLDAQRANLVAVATYTADSGWPGHATRLADTLYRYLSNGGHLSEAVTVYTCARRAARQTSDHAAEASALLGLGTLDIRLDRYGQAAQLLQQALDLFRQVGDPIGEARALDNLAITHALQGRYQQFVDLLEQSLPVYRKTGDLTGEARVLGNLGWDERLRGHYAEAAGHLQQALALFRRTGDTAGEARTLAYLGDTKRRQGRYGEAGDHLRRALAMHRDAGDHVAVPLTFLGLLDLRQGRYTEATDHLSQALALHRENADKAAEAETLNGLGDVFLATGQHRQACTQYTAALDLAGQIGRKYEQARAHDGLGRAHHDLGDPVQARHHQQEALARYTELGDPEADQVRARLAGLGAELSEPSDQLAE